MEKKPTTQDGKPLHRIFHERMTANLKRGRGRPKHFESAQQLLDEVMEYFDWLENNPLELDNIVSDNGSALRMEKRKQRAPTIQGMCLFLGISTRSWEDLRKNDDEDIRMLHQSIHELIRERKFVYGAANELNARIIAMDLGLSSSVKVEGGDAPIRVQVEPGMDPKQAAQAYAATLEDE